MIYKFLLNIVLSLSLLDDNGTIQFVSSFSQIKVISSTYKINNYNNRKTRPHQLFSPHVFIKSRLSGISDGQTSQTPEIKEAELLRLKARQLLQEANAAEESLKEKKQASKESLNLEIDSLIDMFLEKYSKNYNLEEGKSKMVDTLREKRLPLEKVKNLIDRLLEKESIARGYGSVNINNPLPGQFNLADTRNSSEEDIEYAEKIKKLMDMIISAEEELDVERLENRERSGKRLSAIDRISSDDVFAPILRSIVKETRKSELDAFKRRLSVQVSNSFENTDDAGMRNVEQLAKETLNITDSSAQALNRSKFNFMVDLMSVPLWVPSSLLDFVIRCNDTISSADVKLFKNEILGGSRFYCTSSDSTTLAAIYRGNFLTRPNDKNSTTLPISSLGFQDIQERLDNFTGLKDRIQMFLMNDPEWRPGNERYPDPKPVIILVPSTLSPQQSNERGLMSKVFITLSALVTFFTTFAYSLVAYSLNPDFFNAIVNDNNVSVITKCIPIFLGVIALQSIHDLAHKAVAKINNIKLGFPVPLPSLQIGTFGTITPLRSFPANRSNLLDIALSGPCVTMILSIILILTGINFTVNTPADVLPTLPVLPVAVMKSSFLVGSIVSFLAPKVMLLPLSQLIPINPCFIIGFTGLVSSALNLLPIGRLDGGRASTASFGRRSANIISLLTLGILAISALSGFSTISIFWGLIVTLFQRQAEIPVRDEFEEVDDIRFGAFIISLIFSALVLIPFPGGVGL